MSVCDKTTRLIAAAMGRDLEPNEARFLKEHAAGCAACREHLAAAGAVTGMLKGLVPAEADTPLGFGDRLRDRLLDRSGRRNWYGYLPTIRFRPMELGLLAGLLLCALATVGFFYFNEEHPQPLLLTSKEVSTETPLSIDLEYLAVHPIREVAVTIELDAGVKFHSDYAEVAAARSHTWTGKFTEGMNSIPFMVTVEKPGTWQIRTRADFGGWRHEHLITLTSTGKMVTMAQYQLPKHRI
ncbi:MAG TPA: zf-HC2 domain-containing protein [bacterium]|nr:zf-HC2 domain-containing protein [bacterium]